MKLERPIGLIVEADEPALFFSSPKAAETYIEAIDVQDGVYKAAYDPEGNPYRISVDGGRVLIAPDIDRPNNADELKIVLLRFLSSVNIHASRQENLEELIAKCSPYIAE